MSQIPLGVRIKQNTPTPLQADASHFSTDTDIRRADVHILQPAIPKAPHEPLISYSDHPISLHTIPIGRHERDNRNWPCLDLVNSAPDFFNEYQSARSIVNIRGGRKTNDTPTPAPVPTPA